MDFVNRERELAQLDRWWAQGDSGSIGIVWGRRRVGKTELVRRFATDRRMVYHIAARRPLSDELRVLSVQAAPMLAGGFRDPLARPFVDWTDALESLGAAAATEPLLLVLDEFPELLEVTPELPSILRAVWDRIRHQTRLRILLCGSAVRTMDALQQQREPLYGRFELALLLHPFFPHEAALMLPALRPAERALVWGLVGGMPQYLAWWDQGRSVSENLDALVCTPGGRLLAEGDLLLATEAAATDLGGQALYAIAAGRSRFNEIGNALHTDPTRILERLRALQLIARTHPITEDERASRRRVYHVADNFLAFWLGVVARHRSQIDLGLGPSVLPTILRELDDFMGPRWESAFRDHLRRLANRGDLGHDVVAIGRFWNHSADQPDQVEIDAVALAGRERAACLVGEAKWAHRADATRLQWDLERKARALPRVRTGLRYAVAARDAVDGGDDNLLRITATEIFSA